jgi:hypothetical protein
VSVWAFSAACASADRVTLTAAVALLAALAWAEVSAMVVVVVLFAVTPALA